MEKKLITFLTILVVFVGIPYIVYMLYINHQDDLYRTLTEYSSYTTIDKAYDIKLMKYRGLSGEETYNFKIYMINNSTNEIRFVKNISVSAYGTMVEYNEKKEFGIYDLNIMIKSSSSSDMVTLDCNNMIVKGQKIRGVF